MADGKPQLLAAIDNPNGIHESDWICLFGLIEDIHPLWEEIYHKNGYYFIPEKYKAQLKETLMDPSVVITYYPEDQEDNMVMADEDTLPPRIDRRERARKYFEFATAAFDIGDYHTAMSELEEALKLDEYNHEYMTFGLELARLIDRRVDKVIDIPAIEPKVINISALRCGKCNGPYAPETGHAFMVDGELKGVACGPCARRWWERKATKHVKLSKGQRRKKNKREARERAAHLARANQIIAEARSHHEPDIEIMENEGGFIKDRRDYIYPYWPESI